MPRLSPQPFQPWDKAMPAPGCLPARQRRGLTYEFCRICPSNGTRIQRMATSGARMVNPMAGWGAKIGRRAAAGVLRPALGEADRPSAGRQPLRLIDQGRRLAGIGEPLLARRLLRVLQFLGEQDGLGDLFDGLAPLLTFPLQGKVGVLPANLEIALQD